MIKAEIDVDQVKRQRAMEVRIMKDKAAVGIARWSLPTIILLFAFLVGSILYIEDAAMIAIIASATSSTSMALISIISAFTGAKEKDDPYTAAMKMQSDITTSLIDYIKADKNKSTELVLDDKAIKVVDGNIQAAVSSNILYGKDEKPKR